MHCNRTTASNRSSSSSRVAVAAAVAVAVAVAVVLTAVAVAAVASTCATSLEICRGQCSAAYNIGIRAEAKQTIKWTFLKSNQSKVQFCAK